MSGEAGLVRVARVITEEGRAVTLQLEDGRALKVAPGVRAALSPELGDRGLTLLTSERGRVAEVCFTVPAVLLPEMQPHFLPRRARLVGTTLTYTVITFEPDGRAPLELPHGITGIWLSEWDPAFDQLMDLAPPTKRWSQQ